MITLRDRYQGCLLGLATADAVGATVEFMPPGSFAPVTDLVGGGPFNLEPGEWTDDTSMALCLAESLIERRSFDPRDQMERYVRWWREGHLSSNGDCFDIGGTVAEALRRFEASGDPYSGSTDPYSAGNGSLMRLAPVPLAFAHNALVAVRLSAESSRTTHGAVECLDACRYFAVLLIGALAGESKEALLQPGFSPAGIDLSSPPLAPRISAIAQGSYRHKSPPAIRGTGYVVDCLEAALWAFWTGESFEEGCLLAVNLGEDADTTATVFGQLAGAYFGVGGIPVHWLGRLAHRPLITRMADELLELAASAA